MKPTDKTLRIELIYERTCPNIEPARTLLRAALQQLDLPEQWQEWDSEDPVTPESRRNHGSPTILINGRDVAAEAHNDSACCRVYHDNSGKMQGAPSIEDILSAIKSI